MACDRIGGLHQCREVDTLQSAYRSPGDGRRPAVRHPRPNHARAIRLPGLEKAILSDTVGFISDLPTQLVAAFRATLEEVTAADLILHVRDIANVETEAQKSQVLEVLSEIGITPEEGGEMPIPIVEVWNKWDLLDPERAADLAAVAERDDDQIITISALTGEGCDALLSKVGEQLTEGAKLYTFVLSAGDGERLAFLHARGQVLSEKVENAAEGPNVRLKVRLSERELGRFSAL
jgi:GTP-binding protein HflX